MIYSPSGQRTRGINHITPRFRPITPTYLFIQYLYRVSILAEASLSRALIEINGFGWAYKWRGLYLRGGGGGMEWAYKWYKKSFLNELIRNKLD